MVRVDSEETHVDLHRSDSMIDARQVYSGPALHGTLAQMLDRLSLGFLLVGEDMAVRYVNECSEIHLGVRRAEVTGRHLRDAVPTAWDSWFGEFHREVVATRAEVTVIAASPRLPGRTIEVTGYWVGSDVAIICRDVTAAQGTLTHLLEAYHSILDRFRRDELTGVLTRAALLEQLASRRAAAAAVGAVLFVDVDDFKTINDVHGHRAGDHFLRILAGRLAEQCGPADIVGRIGGDEFVIGVAATADRLMSERAEELSVRLRRSAAEAIRWDGAQVRMTISVGIAIDTGAESLVDLLADADADLYRAKRRLAATSPRSVGPTTCARPAKWARPNLTAREVEVLLSWCGIESKAATAKALHLAVGTVNTHLTRIRRKYADVGRPAPTKAALVARALQDGLIDITDI